MPQDDNGSTRLDRIERVLEEHTRQIGMLLQHGQETNLFLNRIAEAHLRLAEAQNRHEEAQNRLETAQAETTEKLNALISIVDEIVRRGGKELK